jgi:uncharacterized protein YndB with AHSA1/START domain
MPPMVSTIEIARPPDEVFSYVTDPSRFAEWQRDVVSARIEGGRPAGAGSRFTTTRRVAGAQRTMTQEVTEVSAPRTWAARGVDGPIRPSARVTVEPLDDGARSRGHLRARLRGHGIGKPLLPAVRRRALKVAPTSDRT